MIEEAGEIFEYLPISLSEVEANYIDHLWKAFITLDGCSGESESARPFAIMPFHLLFMYALQCKVLRIAKNQKEHYELAFTMEYVREDQSALLNPPSPFEIALLNESKIIDLLKIIKLDKQKIREIKFLVRNRNDNLAHAKGHTELDPDARIEEYLTALRNLQVCLFDYNERIALEWTNEKTAEDDLVEFVTTRLLGTYLCLADFKIGELKAKFSVLES